MPCQEYGKTQRCRGRDSSLESNHVLNWDVVAQILFVSGKMGTEVDVDAMYHPTLFVLQQNLWG